ncbi:hypothetical protein [Clostridium beijerinckii]|jgi:FOG: Glucan-binding domain (YG repeat)|uniref:Putative cell wall binding repeat protein n=1 Tax=Clostridium beijerinckii TaxID=1520 RepID=A0A1S8RZ34_CLOBE|nr:hypothetical protein [Clostridium beijerinckii]NRY61532.1 hypothetical protein [Clostridium beijerinckii]OOM58468.1 putative cell wall binding repeat protein [Clostridium beijerinckii]
MKKYLTKSIAMAIVAMSVMTFSPLRANAEWKQDNKGWWYTQGNSYSTGWELIGGNWYYFDSDGYMVTNTSSGGYYLNENGAWSSSVSLDEAQKMIEKVTEERKKYDSSFRLVYNGVISKNNTATGNWPGDYSNLSIDKFYNLIGTNEDMYYFEIPVMDHYFVGKETGRVYYFCPGNGLATLEVQENGVVVKSWCKDKKGDQNWY